jgi:hypothetical protein
MASIGSSSAAGPAGGPGAWSLWGVPDPNPTRAATRFDGERIAFENLGYRIAVGNDATVHVLNRTSGDHYVYLGKLAPEAAGATTLLLDDGTKLTIEGAVSRVDPGLAVTAKVSITNHDYGVQVLGVDGQVQGDLRYVETTAYGWALDAAVRDGTQLAERTLGSTGGPWHVVRAHALRGREADSDAVIELAWREVLLSLAALMTITMAGAFTGAWAPRGAAWAREAQAIDRERDAGADAPQRARRRPADPGVHPSWGGHG